MMLLPARSLSTRVLPAGAFMHNKYLTFWFIIKFKVTSLEKPWGVCNNQSKPMSYCVMKCKTDHVVSRCGCREIYMTSDLDGEIHPMSIQEFIRGQFCRVVP